MFKIQDASSLFKMFPSSLQDYFKIFRYAVCLMRIKLKHLEEFKNQYIYKTYKTFMLLPCGVKYY